MGTKEENENADLCFERAYARLAKHGACDSPGGREYRRVKAEWIEAGRPDGCIDCFIRRHANLPADTPMPQITGETTLRELGEIIIRHGPDHAQRIISIQHSNDWYEWCVRLDGLGASAATLAEGLDHVLRLQGRKHD